MPLELAETGISGLTVITPHQFNDGIFSLQKYFQKDDFKNAGLPVDFSEANIVAYKKGARRGLHYQKTPSQGKLVFAVAGQMFIAAVDLREISKTFGKCGCFNISAEKKMAIYIPSLFAFGVLSLEENTMLCYNCTGEYIPENCGGILWDDRELNIPWPLNVLGSPPEISEKDRNLQTFARYRERKYV